MSQNFQQKPGPRKGQIKIYLSDLNDAVKQHLINIERKKFYGMIISIHINKMNSEEVLDKYGKKLFGNRNKYISVPIE